MDVAVVASMSYPDADLPAMYRLYALAEEGYEPVECDGSLESEEEAQCRSPHSYGWFAVSRRSKRWLRPVSVRFFTSSNPGQRGLLAEMAVEVPHTP